MDINICDLLGRGGVVYLSQATDPRELFSQVLPPFISFNGRGIIYQEDIIDRIMEREKTESTGVGRGIAFPHTRIDGLEYPLIKMAILKTGIAYGAIDNSPCDIFILIIDSDVDDIHLKLLASLAKIFKDRDFVQKLRSVDSSEEALRLLEEKERKGVLV